MKLTELLIITWCSVTVARSKTVESNQETLLKKAAEQLERLEPYRRATDNRGEPNLSNVPETWKSLVDQNQLEGIKDDIDQNVSWEMSEILPEQTKPDSLKRIDNKNLITVSVITNPKYAELMQNRIKRGYDVGSTSLLTSIAGGVLTGIASASSGSAAKASAGSSETAYKSVYGAPVEHTYSYEEKPFGPWDFKKVIFSTLFQALKAIGGGVLALKGQLVKGGGYLLAGKGKVVSKAGDVITSFGKQLAANAQSKPYPSETYYDHPPVQHIEHNSNYPPPNSDDFSEVSNDFSAHETYGVPSNDNGQGGLLIVTPTKSDLDKNNDQQMHVAVLENPDSTKSSVIKNLLNSVPKGSVGSKDQTVAGQDSLINNNVNSYPLTQHPVPTYGVPERYPTNYNNPTHNYGQYNPAAQDGAYQPELPQVTSHHHFPNLGLDPNLLIQPNVKYPPLQQIQYPNPHGSLLDPSKLPHDDSDTSVYASLSVDTEPQIAPLKISLLGHSDSFDLPKLQPHVDFYGQPQFNHLHGSLGGPLRVPLLNPMPSAYYWRSQGSLIPTSAFDTLDNFRKRNVQRRAFAKRLARYASLQRFHRL